MLFTVFTPVFNRRETLDRVYDSLSSQTCQDFEWILVDDGSTDDSFELIESYRRQAQFPVIVHRQPNRGKHSAWNWAVRKAAGELFVPADSDDAFVPETLECFTRHWQQIPSSERSKYSGINVLCKDSESGETVGDLFPSSPMDSNSLDLVYHYRVKGEKWGCIRTDLLKQRPFPEATGYFPESYIWHSLAREYKVRCINEKLRIYYQDTSESIMTNVHKLNRHSADAKTKYYLWHLNDNIDYLSRYRGYSEVLLRFIHFWYCALLSRANPIRLMRQFTRLSSRALAILTFPAGCVAYCVLRGRDLLNR